MLAARGVDVCTEYGVALAAEDFVPCILAAGALVILVLMVRERVPKAFPAAALGALLIAGGGLSKATWKMLVATGCWEYPILEQVLFPFISFGFAAMAWALLSTVKDRLVLAWPFVAFPAAAGLGAVWMGDTWPLLIAAAVGATFFGVTAAATAFKAGKTSVGVLFVIYVLGTNVLPPLAAQPTQSAANQWAAQLTNTAIQLCFLLGALWLREHLTTRATAVAEQKTGAPA